VPSPWPGGEALRWWVTSAIRAAPAEAWWREMRPPAAGPLLQAGVSKREVEGDQAVLERCGRLDVLVNKPASPVGCSWA